MFAGPTRNDRGRSSPMRFLNCGVAAFAVEGRFRTHEFEDKNGGGKRQRAEIVAQRVQFLGARPEAPVGGEAEEPAASEETPF
jgi:single-stranded DNA-binding protein